MSLKKFLHGQKKHFEKGEKLETLEPLYEMVVSFFFPFYEDTHGKTHVRDPLELKRMMMMVVFALIPATLMAFYNTGMQANRGVELLLSAGATVSYTWHQFIMLKLGVAFDSASVLSNVLHGAMYFFPLYVTVIAVGGTIELIFALVRKHSINESFLVTSLLFPLVLPPTVPLWQAAAAIAFGIFFGKELFGGTGRNIVNPALLSRAFLFLAYPASATGEAIWYGIDGGSGATPLGALKAGGELTSTWLEAFVGVIPGSMGETSALACVIGALILIYSRIASMRIMVSGVVGLAFVVTLGNMFGGGSANNLMTLGIHWHLVLGGFAFGIVFMATDPVTAAFTKQGKCIYGFLVGAITGMVRLVGPGYPEGVMFAILFANVVTPSIDYYFIKQNIKRREVRCAN